LQGRASLFYPLPPMGWSVYYKLVWEAPPASAARAVIAERVDAYNRDRGVDGEPLAFALDQSSASGAVKIHSSASAEDDYAALIAALAAIADALPAATAEVSDDYCLLTAADPRNVRVARDGKHLLVHDEAALPLPRDAPPDVLRELVRRAELVAARSRTFREELADADVVFQPSYPQAAENSLTEAVRYFEEYLRKHAGDRGAA
jgi:hypothetical protein